MIDYFAGPLGKLKNIGSSKIYTTPHTVKVDPEYSITLPDEVQGELIAQSRDGRLWFYLDDTTLHIVALKWNQETARLDFATTQNISSYDETVLACGIDWILTNNNIFSVSDNEPYIFSSNLFDADIPNSFLYSILRLKRIMGTQALDPFTNIIWGQRDNNGNFNGDGYFSKETHLLYPAGKHIFEQCYALLPAVGNWQIFENFLIRRPDAEKIDSYNYMHSIRPLIPLEICYNSTPILGTGYNFTHKGINLVYSNGQLWGKGLCNIGRVYLLPAVFSDNDEPLEYYLYISSDFPCSPYFDYKDKLYPSLEGKDSWQLSYFNGHTFCFFQQRGKNWQQAKEACEALGGHLATNTSLAKNDFLSSILPSGANAWLGGYYDNNSATWKWTTGEDFDASNYWFTSGAWPNYAIVQNGTSLDIFPNTYTGSSFGIADVFYICEWDYLLENNEEKIDPIFETWFNTNLCVTNNDMPSVYGFLAPSLDARSSSSCIAATEPKLFFPHSNSWDDFYADNAILYISSLSSSAMIITDNDIKLFSKGTYNLYNCNALAQWVAPTREILAFNEDYIISRFYKGIALSSIINGFYRQVLEADITSISAMTFHDATDNRYSLAVQQYSDNNKVLAFNSFLTSQAIGENIQWLDIYKPVVSWKLLNILPFSDSSTAHPNVITYNYKNNTPLFVSKVNIIVRKPITPYKKVWVEERNEYVQVWPGDEYLAQENTIGLYSDPDYDYITYEANAILYYFDPVTGVLSQKINISCSFPTNIVMKTYTRAFYRIYYGDGTVWYDLSYDYQLVDYENSIWYELDSDSPVVINNDKIGFLAIEYPSEYPYKRVFFPAADIPEEIVSYSRDIKTISRFDNPNIIVGENAFNYIPLSLPSSNVYIKCVEYSSGISFFFDISSSSLFPYISSIFSSRSASYSVSYSKCETCCNTDNLDEQNTLANQSLYILRISWSGIRDDSGNWRPLGFMFLVFRIEYHPEILDFDAELERSKPS